ncbi:unnamed protein product [Menidia menidia]|uniref:(Atlantic silverside) hypothetical protein n=1 Tax=Menidia menidia TaxID=238744 RepID=A0A8S4BQF4_9TELE|nr:unnamed protein product [Menidia menidia]
MQPFHTWDSASCKKTASAAAQVMCFVMCRMIFATHRSLKGSVRPTLMRLSLAKIQVVMDITI